MHKKLVWFKARVYWPCEGGVDASDPANYEKGMVIVNFKDEDELKEKLKKYAISQVHECVRKKTTVEKLKFKIIDEI